MICIGLLVRFLIPPPFSRLSLLCVLLGIAGMIAYSLLTMVGKGMRLWMAPALAIPSLGGCAAILIHQSTRALSGNTSVVRFGLPLLGVVALAGLIWQAGDDSP